jgi:hypothetical protein
MRFGEEQVLIALCDTLDVKNLNEMPSLAFSAALFWQNNCLHNEAYVP